jgi:hypothetical protein
MLTRTKLWRKMELDANDSSSDDSDNTEDSFVSTDEGDSPEGPSPTSSPNVTPVKTLQSALKTRRSSDECSELPGKKEARTMRFSSTVHICLVLSRAEMKPLMTDLFWKADEYVRFKHDAVNELRSHLTINGITAKEAIFDLYQPHEHERQQWLAEFDDSHKLEDTDEDSFSTQSPTDNDFLCDIDDAYNSDDDSVSRQSNSTVDLKNAATYRSDNGLDKPTHAVHEISNNGTLMPTKAPLGSAIQHGWAVSWRPKSRLHQ